MVTFSSPVSKRWCRHQTKTKCASSFAFIFAFRKAHGILDVFTNSYFQQIVHQDGLFHRGRRRGSWCIGVTLPISFKCPRVVLTHAQIALSDHKETVIMGRMRNPALSLHGIQGAFSEPGAKTVIPSKVAGKFSLRYVLAMPRDERRASIDRVGGSTEPWFSFGFDTALSPHRRLNWSSRS